MHLKLTVTVFADKKQIIVALAGISMHHEYFSAHIIKIKIWLVMKIPKVRRSSSGCLHPGAKKIDSCAKQSNSIISMWKIIKNSNKFIQIYVKLNYCN